MPVVLVEKYGLEDARQRFLVHADAGVLDRAASTASALAPAAIVEAALAGHRVQRVLDDVGERAGDERAVDETPAAAGRRPGCRSSMRPARPVRYGIDDLGDELRDVDRRAAARSATTRSSRTPPAICRSSRTWPRIEVDAAVEHRPERLAAVGVHAPQVLGRELDRRQRVLDLVRDLPRHLGPRLEAVRAFELIALRLQLAPPCC